MGSSWHDSLEWAACFLFLPCMNLPPAIDRLFPFLRWPRPTLYTLKRDGWAGMTVGLVLVPQAVAYATLAGMPAETGLYAALLPAIIGVLWGSSALLAVGPVALTSLLVFGSLGPLAQPESPEWVALAIWLSLYSGVIQMFLGIFKLGGIANLVSQPVMTGFVNAAAIIIILSQLPALVGTPELARADLQGAAQRWLAAPKTTLLPAAFGGVALVLMLASKRFFPNFPGILAVSVLAILASYLLGYAERGGEIVGPVSSGLPSLALPPAIPLVSHQELWPAALVLALVSFTEAMGSCRTLSRKTKQRWDENQELIGQGLAKIASGFNGAFPVSGSFSRSALNLYAGAVSAWSTLFATACVFFSLLFLTDVLYYMPRAVLAAIVMVPVFGLINLGAFRRLLVISRTEGMIAAATFIITLSSMPRLHWGVLAGIGLTMTSFLYRRTRPRVVEVSQHEDGTLRDRSRFNLPPLAPDLLAVRIDAALNFLTASALERFITERCQVDRKIKRVLLCANGINDIDATGVDVLEILRASLRGEGIELYVSAIKKQVWDVLNEAGTIDAIGPRCIFATDRQAAQALGEGWQPAENSA